MDLKTALQTRGSDLIILAGEPAVLLPELIQRWAVAQLSWQTEHTPEEVDSERAVRRALVRCENLVIETWEGLTLLHPDDLPYSAPRLAGLPNVFTEFRKTVEKSMRVRKPLSDPGQPFTLPSFIPRHDLSPEQDWPQPEHPLWPTGKSPDGRSAFPFSGGMASGLERLRHFVQADGALRTYKNTRNGLVGADYSSKLSAWLANGCLSPRQVYQAVKNHEAQFGANDSTYWLVFELLWRDFFRFQAIKQGSRLFAVDGVQRKGGHDGVQRKGRKEDRGRLTTAARTNGGAESGAAPRGLSPEKKRAFERWAGGRTGQPFIDANMRELAATGWMSNRGRQNVASYLVHDLGVDWRMGAWWFESLLLDYDVASNWGNWQYAAGIGLDPRSQGSGQRRFNPEKQAAQYDSDGAYVRLWADKTE